MSFFRLWLLSIVHPSAAFDRLREAIHALISVWEVVLFGIGLSKMRELRFWPACLLGLVVKGGVYIPLAIIFVR